ncbi:Uncharacterised protein [Mycobacterium tuberculosis]|nr:Uncharacterised protein [Mycobacterium tuberculosis]
MASFEKITSTRLSIRPSDNRVQQHVQARGQITGITRLFIVVGDAALAGREDHRRRAMTSEEISVVPGL